MKRPVREAFAFLLLLICLLFSLNAFAQFQKVLPNETDPNPFSRADEAVKTGITFNGYAYIGTWNKSQGCVIYRIQRDTTSGTWSIYASAIPDML